MKTQRGNILFLILLAVILFVALSQAVTGSMGGGTKNASSESAKATAARVVQYATLLENTVTRLRMIGNCKETEISFEYPIGTNVNPALSGDKRCNVFDLAGGGVPWQTFDVGPIMEPWFTAKNQIKNVGMDCGTGGSASIPCLDLAFMLRDIRADICVAINQQLGIPTDPVPIESDITYSPYFVGTYSSGNRIVGNDSRAAPLVGGRTGCLQETGQSGFSTTTPYTFYHVLIAR